MKLFKKICFHRWRYYHYEKDVTNRHCYKCGKNQHTSKYEYENMLYKIWKNR